jgi:hypothetical protein
MTAFEFRMVGEKSKRSGHAAGIRRRVRSGWQSLGAGRFRNHNASIRHA